MRTRAAWGALLLLASAWPAAADDREDMVMARVRFTTEPGVVRGCTRIGAARDDSVKDLRRKIVRAGGDTALLAFGGEDLSAIHAQIFRCQASGPPPAGAPAPPPPPSGAPNVPAPPPGPPPPPPPSR
jgi:hypothetical protein